MFGTPYAHDELAKYTAIFGTLFNNVRITRDGDDGKVLQSFKVPINYGPREKALARTDSDPELDRPYAELLPRMAFELTSFEYDGDRKKTSTAKWASRKERPNGRVSYNSMFMPVPYNFHFTLTILANRMSDATRILGSIIPNFRPDLTVSAAIVDEMPDYVIDIPISIVSTQKIDEYEGDFRKGRIIEYRISFVMKAEMYGPVSEAKIIKIAKVNMHGSFDGPTIERYTTQPGLTADGKPTDDISQTISPLLIDETDDYGYIITIQDKDFD